MNGPLFIRIVLNMTLCCSYFVFRIYSLMESPSQALNERNQRITMHLFDGSRTAIMPLSQNRKTKRGHLPYYTGVIIIYINQSKVTTSPNQTSSNHPKKQTRVRTKSFTESS